MRCNARWFLHVAAGWLSGLSTGTNRSDFEGGLMSTVEPPQDDNEEDAETASAEADDDSVVAPPAYPAYSTPPPEGLGTSEDG